MCRPSFPRVPHSTIYELCLDSSVQGKYAFCFVIHNSSQTLAGHHILWQFSTLTQLQDTHKVAVHLKVLIQARRAELHNIPTVPPVRPASQWCHPWMGARVCIYGQACRRMCACFCAVILPPCITFLLQGSLEEVLFGCICVCVCLCVIFLLDSACTAPTSQVLRVVWTIHTE